MPTAGRSSSGASKSPGLPRGRKRERGRRGDALGTERDVGMRTLAAAVDLTWWGDRVRRPRVAPGGSGGDARPWGGGRAGRRGADVVGPPAAAVSGLDA